MGNEGGRLRDCGGAVRGHCGESCSIDPTPPPPVDSPLRSGTAPRVVGKSAGSASSGGADKAGWAEGRGGRQRQGSRCRRI